MTEEAAKPSFVPQGRRKPKYDLSKAKILLYGPPKIGKSTLTSKFPGVWFLATEEGQDWLEVYEPTQISSWEQFLELCRWIDETRPTTFGDGTPIKTLAIDTIDLLFKMCNDYMCQQLGVSSMGDLDWGKGWSALSDEFQRVMTKITRWPYGLIWISHSKEQEIKSKATKIDRIQPAIANTGLKVVQGLADIILYCFADEVAVVDGNGDVTGQIKEQRMLRCTPRNNIVAGDRTGCLPDQIPLDFTALLQYFPETFGQVNPTPEEGEVNNE